MTTLRFGLPYRTAEKGASYRLGYAVVDVRDVPRSEVETAIMLPAIHQNFFDTEFILHEGKLWEKAFVKSVQGSLDFFTEAKSADREAEKAVHMMDRIRTLPFRMATDYNRNFWAELPRDSVDMHEDFVASRTWDAIHSTSDRALMVDGELFRVSAGPIYRCSSKSHRWSNRQWNPSALTYSNDPVECYGFERVVFADRVAMERHGRLFPLAEGWGPPEFRIPADQLPHWDSLSPAIENLATQAISSTNLFHRYYLTRSSTRALINLRDALQSRFDNPVKVDTRGVYALPASHREPWQCPDAAHLLDPLFEFLASNAEFRKRVSLDAGMLRLRLKHESQFIGKVDFDDPDLLEAFKI